MECSCQHNTADLNGLFLPARKATDGDRTLQYHRISLDYQRLPTPRASKQEAGISAQSGPQNTEGHLDQNPHQTTTSLKSTELRDLTCSLVKRTQRSTSGQPTLSLLVEITGQLSQE